MGRPNPPVDAAFGREMAIRGALPESEVVCRALYKVSI